MAKATTAYHDSKGNLHSSAEGATLADLSHILGRQTADDGRLARLIFDQRPEIERIFAEHDAMVPKPGKLRAA